MGGCTRAAAASPKATRPAANPKAVGLQLPPLPPPLPQQSTGPRTGGLQSYLSSGGGRWEHGMGGSERAMAQEAALSTLFVSWVLLFEIASLSGRRQRS